MLLPFRITNRILGLFGLEILRTSSSFMIHHGLGISRVTVKGMKKAIKRSRELFPDRTVIAVVDYESDDAGILFEKVLDCPVEIVSGSPAKDIGEYEISLTSFVFGLDSDEQASAYLAYVTENEGKYFCTYDTRNARWWHLHDKAREVLMSEQKDCQVNNHTHFAPDQLANLMQAIDITKCVDGDYVEIGVFRGTSARLSFHYMSASHIQRKCYFMDTFAGFDYDSALSSADAHWQGTHNASMDGVDKRLQAIPEFDGAQPTYELVKSNIVSDNLPDGIESIAMCNIDVDIYDAVLMALKKTWPLISKRGICIVQDPGRTPLLGGAKLALDQFLSDIDSKECQPIYLESGQTFLIKL
ncbi:MAG: hypothetical protein HQ506_02155 [Candidatus Marinimicrobia bacterium]|nr:hypothetical protein [Candidatus Neomarinimicrobiota bacterium]